MRYYFICFFLAITSAGCSRDTDYTPLSLEVKDKRFIAQGVIDGSTPDVISTAIKDHPDITTMVFENVPGSADDISNLQAAGLIRRAGFTTLIPSYGMVASGGTDLFLAGKIRHIEPGACIGVHSWGGGGFLYHIEGAELPKDHPEHKKYIDYYKEMGTDPEFYWFTLKAAGSADIYWMNHAEINAFDMASTPLSKREYETKEKRDKRCNAK